MYHSQYPWVELYSALLEYDGKDAHADILVPWVMCNPGERRWLAEFASRDGGHEAEASVEERCRLYAASRVTSILLLRFQEDRGYGGGYAGPPISPEGFRQFHESLGFRVPAPTPFHPFYHEIVGVEQAGSPEAPIEVAREAWPALMLGDMMYCRAGCIVSGGAAHVAKEIAEQSKMYWSFRRKDRPCEDLSHGWGSNSQWRTSLRRDYRSPAGFHFNVDGRESLNADAQDIDEIGRTAMLELLLHRCMTRTATDDADLYPYPYRFDQNDGAARNA